MENLTGKMHQMTWVEMNDKFTKDLINPIIKKLNTWDYFKLSESLISTGTVDAFIMFNRTSIRQLKNKL